MEIPQPLTMADLSAAVQDDSADAHAQHPAMQTMATAHQQQAGGSSKGPAGKEQQQPVMHHGGSFGQYMALKNAKLREQFEANQYQSMAKSNIFAGVGIYVNGYTQPSHAGTFSCMANACHSCCFVRLACCCLQVEKF